MIDTFILYPEQYVKFATSFVKTRRKHRRTLYNIYINYLRDELSRFSHTHLSLGPAKNTPSVFEISI